MPIQSFVIVADKISGKDIPRAVCATTAQEALAIEFGCHFVRLMNEERHEAEVQVIRASLIDGHIALANGRYKIQCYKRFDGIQPKRYGGRPKSEFKWIGMSTQKIHKDILARLEYLKRKIAELDALHISVEELAHRQAEISTETKALLEAASVLKKYLDT